MGLLSWPSWEGDKMITVKDGQVYQTADVTKALDSIKGKMTYIDQLEKEAKENYQQPIEIIGDLPEYGSIATDTKAKMSQMLEGVNAKSIAADFGAAAAGVGNDIKDAAAGAVDKISGSFEAKKEALIIGAVGLAVLLIITR